MVLIMSFLMGFYSKAVTVDPIYTTSLKTIDGKATDLTQYKGKVLLIVNTASKCGFTPQYEGLQKLYEKYHAKGVEVLGFPSNDFGAQEPAPNEEIKKFCKVKYGVSFPLFEKGSVSGAEKQPLFAQLINAGPDKSEIKWNFEKFLVGKDGKLAQRFNSKVKPDDAAMTSAIEKLL